MKLAERVYTARDVRRMTGWNPSRSYQFMKRHGWQIGGIESAYLIYRSQLQEKLKCYEVLESTRKNGIVKCGKRSKRKNSA